MATLIVGNPFEYGIGLIVCVCMCFMIHIISFIYMHVPGNPASIITRRTLETTMHDSFPLGVTLHIPFQCFVIDEAYQKEEKVLLLS